MTEHFAIAALTPQVCWELFERVVDAATAPVTFRVQAATGCVLHVAQPGTSALNEVAVVRKTHTAMQLGRSTAAWGEQLRASGLSADTHPLADPATHTDIAGGVALISGDFVVGAAAVSGMAATDDHRVLAAALVWHAESYHL